MNGNQADGRRCLQPGRKGAAATFARGMADKPRVKAPKQRTTSSTADPDRRRRLLLIGAVLAALAAAAVLFAAFGRAGGGPDDATVRGLDSSDCRKASMRSETR